MGASSDRAGAGGVLAKDVALPVDALPGIDAVAAIMRRPRAPLPIRHADPEEINRPIPDELGRQAVGPGIQTYDRPFDKEAADYFTGEHALIRRPTAVPGGRHIDLGLPSPVVWRPKPLPWWCGTVVTPQTPAPTSSPAPADAPPAFANYGADQRGVMGRIQ